MLKTIVEKKRYCFHESFDTWQDAIKAACQPLLDDNTIENEYVEAIIKCVSDNGPYIVIAPNIAMPHSTLGHSGVNDNAISFMKVEKPVVFDENDREKDAQIFFTLAAVDNDSHLQNMMQLAEMLMDENICTELATVKNENDLLAIQEKYLNK